MVVAPSLVPSKSGDRVKTDRRDARKLAHFLRSGDLTEVHVPEEAVEAIRDLERARDDAKCAERAARHQLSKFLLRNERRWDGEAWTKNIWTGFASRPLPIPPSSVSWRIREGGGRLLACGAAQQQMGELVQKRPWRRW